MASFDPMTTLLVMALKEESQGLFEETGIRPFYTGVGQVKATFSVTEAIFKTRPTSILNFGTAGSFNLSQGDCVECSAFVQRHEQIKSRKILAASALTDLKKVVCGTADHVQTDANAHSAEPYEIMDMEAYALAYVADQKKIPFYSIKYITDNSDHAVITDWKKNLNQSAKKLLEIYKQIISGSKLA